MGEPRYKVRVADHEYWREQIKCQHACPVHTDARGYVRAIADGDYERAYLVARGPNPLASLCGRICGAPCEAACRRGTIDQAISIRALPTRECFDLMSQPAFPEALQNLWKQLGCEGEFPGFEWFANYEQYESAYIAIFDVGMPEPPVPLFESAHNNTRPAQEITLENTYFYELLGLKSNSSHAVPDYLVTQLEFLAALRYTREHTSEEATAVSLARAETDFLERHLLNWLPTAKAKLDRTGVPGFPRFMGLLVQFLSQRHAG